LESVVIPAAVALAAKNTAGGKGWLDIAGDVVVPAVAIVAPLVWAVITYVRQQRANRRDRVRDLFSEALRGVADYQELPYLVRRRSDESPMKPSELARHASEVQTRLDYYVVRIRLESAAVADAFDRLVSVTRQEAGAQMTEAWSQPRIVSDAEMPLGTRYTRERAEGEKAACLAAMQAHLDP
jgi:hypothetical protein